MNAIDKAIKEARAIKFTTTLNALLTSAELGCVESIEVLADLLEEKGMKYTADEWRETAIEAAEAYSDGIRTARFGGLFCRSPVPSVLAIYSQPAVRSAFRRGYAAGLIAEGA